MNHSLGKSKKLKGKTTIARVFKDGKSVRKGPLRMVYVLNPNGKESSEHQIGFVVPKRFVKKAVDRNKMKRLMRESYRLQQEIIQTLDSQYIQGMIMYQSSKPMEFEKMFSLMRKLLNELTKRAS
ncbi:ribonuclease P protein component [Nonlabens spongiae]|uniref:Ribonuclease P protein component n=1 Tax=Nonlabens spongiae TaxID=331648 RepID=A0A1W6MLM2_9FLAO|nr:ribonuclease P protein component [Nonlabens spongiae]ARN78472.1 ribonuclease P protein component [Nonlabens spongiae]